MSNNFCCKYIIWHF